MKFALAAAFSALALPALVLSAPAVASAQAAPVAPAPALAPAVSPAAPAPPRIIRGVAPEAVIAWLTTQGVTPGEVQQDNWRTFVRVTADGLAWLLFFQSCDTDGLCSDVQFSTGAANAAITPEMINGWNRDRRFLKAIYEAPEGTTPASAVVQYDVLLNADGAEQLADPLAIWRNLLPEFARVTQGVATAAAPAAQ